MTTGVCKEGWGRVGGGCLQRDPAAASAAGGPRQLRLPAVTAAGRSTTAHLALRYKQSPGTARPWTGSSRTAPSPLSLAVFPQIVSPTTVSLLSLSCWTRVLVYSDHGFPNTHESWYTVILVSLMNTNGSWYTVITASKIHTGPGNGIQSSWPS